MNSVILLAVLMGQCDLSPIRYQYAVCGPIASKYFVSGKVNGRVIEIPIINGETPRVTIWYANGEEVRLFTYNTGRLYNGGVVEFVREYNPPPFTCSQSEIPRDPIRPIPRDRELSPVPVPSVPLSPGQKLSPKRATPPIQEPKVESPRIYGDPKSIVDPNPPPALTPGVDKSPFLIFEQEESESTKSFPRY